MVELAGTVLDGLYRVDRLLEAGGTGVVYAGLHLRLQRPIAIKVVAGQGARDPERVERLHREAIAASRIGSPRIVEVLDLGHLPDGTPYLVMEYLPGRTLEQLLAGTPILPLPRAAALLCQVLEGLGAAHAHGIVHRDVEPANVMVCAAGSAEEFVKLVDFGLSKLASGDGAAALTRVGAQLGTPPYMAPEQVLGRPDVDGRADLWAAGTMLFRALTGRLPHVVSDAAALFTAIVDVDPPPLRALRPDLPVELEALVARALTRDRDRRWGSAAEFRAALLPYARSGAALASAPTLAVASSPPPSSLPAVPSRRAGAVVPPVPVAAGSRRATVGWVLAGLAVAVAAGVTVGVVMTRNEGDSASPLSAPPATTEPAEAVLEALDGGAWTLAPPPAEPVGGPDSSTAGSGVASSAVELPPAGGVEPPAVPAGGPSPPRPDGERARFVRAEAHRLCRLTEAGMAGRGSVEPEVFARLEASAAAAHGFDAARLAELREALRDDREVQAGIERLRDECIARLTGFGTRVAR